MQPVSGCNLRVDDPLQQPVHHIGGVFIQRELICGLVLKQNLRNAVFFLLHVVEGVGLVVKPAVAENLIGGRHFDTFYPVRQTAEGERRVVNVGVDAVF